MPRHRLHDVNTTDLAGAIRLGCQSMSRCFNADDGDLPFGGARVRPDARLAGSYEAHIPGRHLNALLSAEEAAGVTLDESAVDKHARAAFFSYSRAPLPLHRGGEHTGGRGDPVLLQDHDVREGFHALYALARYRDSARALELAEASIRVITEYWLPRERWDLPRLQVDWPVQVLRDGHGTFIQRLARCIGPLVKIHRATGCEPALELALALKEKATREFFGEDGAFSNDLFGRHAHSTTCVMSSLAQLADHTGDAALMARVKAFYDNGLWEMRDQIGWSIEVTDPASDCLRGEANNTGDIVETALILGAHGHPECYDDAERILRSHLLPSQLRDVSFVVEPDNPEGVDGRRSVAERLRGGFGFPAPYGHEPVGLWESYKPRVGFNLDIVGGAVGSLCEALRVVTRRDEEGHWVNLLFDRVTPEIEVRSPYTYGRLGVRLRKPGALHLRVPSWPQAHEIRVDESAGPIQVDGGYLVLCNPPMGRWIDFDFDLPVRESELTWRHLRTRVRFRGDEAVAMDDFGTDLTFFEPFE